jgi:hypothetical protein
MTMRAFLLTAPLMFALTACLGDNLPVPERIGLVSVRAFSNGGTPVVRGSALFYRTAGLQIFPAAPQECALYTYTPPSSSSNAGETLNAGPQVAFTVGSFSEVALPAIGATYPVYNFPGGTYLDFAAGDSVLVAIPGATGGFEPMSIKTRLAEPFTAGAIPAWVANEPMDLTWQAAPQPGSVMVVALRYNSTPGSTAPDLEIACAFADDGTGTIPANLANGWGQAEPGTTEYQFMRVRERIVEFDARTRARVRSVYEVPLTDLVDAQ